MAEQLNKDKKELVDRAMAVRPLPEAAKALRKLVENGTISKEELAPIAARLLGLPISAGAAPCRKSFKCAVVLSPPESVWGPIQTIRRQYDSAYSRWMPHVNLVWPFLREEDIAAAHAVERLTAAAAAHTKPFRVTLGEFSMFEHSKQCVVWLRPDSDPSDAVVTIQKDLSDAFPELAELKKAGGNGGGGEDDEEEGFRPHLTVGRFPKNNADAMRKQLQRGWQPITFEATELHVIARTGDDEPFHIIHRIPIGASK